MLNIIKQTAKAYKNFHRIDRLDLQTIVCSSHWDINTGQTIIWAIVLDLEAERNSTPTFGRDQKLYRVVKFTQGHGQIDGRDQDLEIVFISYHETKYYAVDLYNAKVNSTLDLI